MGRYVAWEDVQKVYRAAARNAGSDSGDGGAFITRAEDEVDARLGARYTVPFTPAPGLVKNLSIDLTWAYMNMNNDKVCQPIFKRVDMLIASVLSGSTVLTTSLGALSPGATVTLTTSGFGSSFGMDDPTAYRVSSSWQQHFASDRGDLT